MKDSSPDGPDVSGGILFYACGGFSAASLKKIEWTAGIASYKKQLKIVDNPFDKMCTVFW